MLLKTEIQKMARNLNRLVTVLSIAILFVCVFAIPVFATAAETEPIVLDPAADIAAMNQKIYTLYLTIRNHIAFPLLSLSFAFCGFRILGAGFVGSGAGVDRGIEGAKRQLMYSVIAFLVVLALPYVISSGINWFRGRAWTPGVVFLPHFMLGGVN